MRLIAAVLDVAAAFAGPESAETRQHWEWEREPGSGTVGKPTAPALPCCYFCWSFLSVSPSRDDVCCCLTGCPSVWPSLLLIAHSLSPLWSNEWQFVIHLHAAITISYHYCAASISPIYATWLMCICCLFFNMKETEAIYVNNYSIFPKARNERVLSVFPAQKRRLEKWIIATDISNQIWKSCRHATVQT